MWLETSDNLTNNVNTDLIDYVTDHVTDMLTDFTIWFSFDNLQLHSEISHLTSSEHFRV